MDDAVTINACLAYADDDGVREHLQVVDVLDDVTGESVSHYTTTAQITDTELATGGLAGYGWVMLKNLDDTNYVDVKTALAGTYFARMYPGMPCGPLYLSAATDLYVKANTAACRIEVLAIQI